MGFISSNITNNIKYKVFFFGMDFEVSCVMYVMQWLDISESRCLFIVKTISIFFLKCYMYEYSRISRYFSPFFSPPHNKVLRLRVLRLTCKSGFGIFWSLGPFLWYEQFNSQSANHKCSRHFDIVCVCFFLFCSFCIFQRYKAWYFMWINCFRIEKSYFLWKII